MTPKRWTKARLRRAINESEAALRDGVEALEIEWLGEWCFPMFPTRADRASMTGPEAYIKFRCARVTIREISTNRYSTKSATVETDGSWSIR